MCTVSYVPYKKGFILTSNRDENPLRVTKLPNKLMLENGTEITRPRDVEKGGTWIAMDENGRAACLLNGAFLRHIKQSSYRMSRGKLVIQAFESESFEEFLTKVVLDNIEPFTLILIEPKGLKKMVWNGIEKYVWKLSSDSVHLWSSATLYTSKDHANKERYFIEALNELGVNQNQILQIHGVMKDTPFIIKHHSIKTVSITQLVFDGEKTKLEYILRKQRDEKPIPISFTLT